MADTKTRKLPKELAALEDLALDLRWTGSHFAESIWRRLDADAWERTHNPHMLLLNTHADRLQEAAADKQLRAKLNEWMKRRDEYGKRKTWFEQTHGDKGLKHVAYFSMEYMLSECLPIHSGGLGQVAGDQLKSASDLGVPYVAIGLLYQRGYFRQVLSPEGRQIEAYPYNEPGTLPIRPTVGPDGRHPRVRLMLPGRELMLRVWEVQVGRCTLYLLDSNHPMNSPWDRGITANLYSAGDEARLLQELVLGVGGWRLLRKLELDVDVVHMNEGHAAFAAVARAGTFARHHEVDMRTALRATRAGNVFTTHTPVPAAFDRFDPEMVRAYAMPTLEKEGMAFEDLLAMGRRDPGDTSEKFNMAYLALRGSGVVNGVARLHGDVSRSLFGDLFPSWPKEEVPIGAITNGVHVPSWDSSAANALWSEAKTKPRWTDDLEGAAAKVADVSDERLWSFRADARQHLVGMVRERLERARRERGAAAHEIEEARRVLDPNTLTIGFARRCTPYKRPTLMLHDEERMAAILRNETRPVQLLIAGKAHPADGAGKEMIQRLSNFAMRADLRDRVVFLADYDISVGQALAGGVDVWLNNPRRPNEACGTSGMKMLVNGGLNLSTLDGWWDEAYNPEVGWQLGDGRVHDGHGDGDEARQLYELIESEIVPMFYERDEQDVPRAWIQKVRSSLSRLTPQFSSGRCVQDYTERGYLIASANYRKRTTGSCLLARELEEWHTRIERDWHTVRFASVEVDERDGRWSVRAKAYLGDLDPEMVRMELYMEPDNGDPPAPVPMRRDGAIAGSVNGFRYEADVPMDRPADHYTARIIPHHPAALVPLESQRILWSR